MRLRAGLCAACLLICILSCAKPPDYTPVFATVQTGGPSGAGTLRGDYDAATRSRNLTEAADRWEQFLKVHKPANWEYEDAYQQQLIQSASWELMRVFYLSGARDKGDQVLKELDPLQLK